jgi:glycosyltransferase involved in cell wall biosynthesis
MSILTTLHPAKIARFVTAVRQEGWRTAFEKAWTHINLARGGRGRSALPEWTGQGKPRLNAGYLNRFWREIAAEGAFHASAAPATLTKARRIAMIGDINLPQCRKYRVEQLAELWAGQGVDYGYCHEGDVPRAVALLQDATHLMLYRTRNVPQMSMYLVEARRLRLPVLYDLDDPLFSIQAYETYANMAALPPALKAHFLSEAPRYLDAMNLADIVTMSTPALADHARQLTARPVHVRRNFADADTLAAADTALATPRGPGAPFTVAFASGSQGHEMDFSLIRDDLADFITAAPDRRLMILGHFELDHLPEALRTRTVRHEFTDYAGYLATLAQADVAVMPLTDDLFNRCKSAVRVLDAAAVAVPGFVSDTGDLATVVRNGTTGRVLHKDDSWRAALEDLATDRAACAAMGQAARADLLARWTARAEPHIIAPEILDWVRQ